MPENSPTEIWRTLDGMADAYESAHGVRPNRMRVGSAVARLLEPDAERRHGPAWPVHPPHERWRSPTPGVWEVSKPDRLPWRERWAARRLCRRMGGHFWHPEGAMIDWFCCVCGTETDGMPQDGSAR